MEFIAKENFSNHYPTSKDIKLHFKLGKSYTKHVIADLRKYAFIDSHSEKKRRLDQLFLSNLLMDTSNGAKRNIVSPEQLVFQLQIIKDFLEKGNYLLHNIRLDTKLKDTKYYHDFQWPIRSLKNKAKVKELNISPAVHAFMSINPTGTVNIILACSRDPFDLTTPKGVTNFQSTCGEIHSILKADLGINEPLISAPSDWELSHCDISVDVPIKLLQQNIDSSLRTDGSSQVHWNFGGGMQLKHLSYIYQFYDKTTFNGNVFRLEEKVSFSPSNRLKLRELEKKFVS